jgi:hypothetical protein
MKQPWELSGKRLVGVGLIAGALLFSSFALADIISGLSTTNSSTNVTITNLPVTKPSDVAAGDLMLASIAIHDGNTVTVTPPAGWTEVLRTDNDTNVGIATYEKIASASEPANYTRVLSPQTRAQGGITRYSGVDPSNPIDVKAGNTGRSTIATTSSITTAAANDEIVAVYALHVGSANFAGDFFSVPTGMTEKYDSSFTNAGPTIASFEATQASSSVVGSKSSTISGNPNQQRDWAAQTIALRMHNPQSISFDSGAIGGDTGYLVDVDSNSVGNLTNGIEFVVVSNQDYAADTVTGVTFNGTPMTLMFKHGRFGAFTYAYCLVAPPSGVHSIVVNSSASHFFKVASASYAGAQQTCTPDAIATNDSDGSNVPSITTALTTVANNAWMASNIVANSQAPSAGTGIANSRTSASNNNMQWGDTGPLNASTTQSTIWNMGGGSDIVNSVLQWSFAPAN